MPFAEVDGTRLHYQVTGADGPPVLLVMGFSMPGDAWRHQVPTLSKHHRVCIYDHRGAGQSDKPEGGYSMRRLADDAVGLMDHLSWDQAHVVGVSMGGMVSQHVALEHRERVRSLSLIATTAGGLRQRIPTFRGLMLFGRGLLGPKAGRLDATARLLFPKSYQKQVGLDHLKSVLQKDFSQPPPKHARRGQLKAVFGHDTRKRLGELAGLPTLVVCPEQDLLVKPRWNRFIHARIPGSRLLSLPHAGHGLVRQAVDELNTALLEHFQTASR